MEGASKENVEIDGDLLLSAVSWNCFNSKVELAVLGDESMSIAASFFRSCWAGGLPFSIVLPRIARV